MLDRKSEKSIQMSIDAISSRASNLTIAQRPSKARNKDKIIAFRQGRVVEQGTHDYLLRSKERYYELVHLQAMAQEKESEVSGCAQPDSKEASYRQTMDECKRRKYELSKYSSVLDGLNASWKSKSINNDPEVGHNVQF